MGKPAFSDYYIYKGEVFGDHSKKKIPTEGKYSWNIYNLGQMHIYWTETYNIKSQPGFNIQTGLCS